LMYFVADAIDSGRRCDKEASMVKWFASEMAERVTSEALQIHGGYGYTTDLPIERYWRDPPLTKIFARTRRVQLRHLPDRVPGGGVAAVQYADYRRVRTEGADTTAPVTTNRREVYNATTNRLHWELTQIWGELDADPDVRAIVVTGAGDRAFSAGGDLDDLAVRNELPAAERLESILGVMREARELSCSIVNCDTPVISAINGVAVGAGLAVALMADISIIVEDARLTDGHIRLGVAAGDHACMVWPLLCGMAKAKYYLLTADFLDGRE